MEHRRSWNTSFSPFQVCSAAASRADDIAALAKKMSALSRTHVTFTHAIFHTQLCHTHIHTYIHTYLHTYIRTYTHTIFSHTFLLCHTLSFTFHFVTHNCFTLSILHHLLCLSFLPRPVPATTFEAQYWKKLTCGVVRSFNLCFYSPTYLIYRSFFIPIYRSIYLPTFLSTYLSIYLSIYLTNYLLPYGSTYLTI